MPNESDRAKAIKDIERRIVIEKALELVESSSKESSSSSKSTDSDESEPEDDLFLSSLFILAAVQEMRYLSPREQLPKSTHFRDSIIPRLDERRFRQLARMARSDFCDLVEKIGSNEVCRGEDIRTIDPAVQILVALYRFGKSGNGAGKVEVSQKFGVSEGPVELFTRRTILAILALEGEYVKWPDTEQREAIKRRIAVNHGFPDCIGMVDGTTLVLELKPVENSEDYFTRKRDYGIAAMIVCDDLRKITYAHCGFTGSTHDSRVYGNSKLSVSPQGYFAGHEYLLADSGYGCSTTVIPAYKKPAANLAAMKKFNTSLASLRIEIEICNGMLKGRFQSLRGLRILIRKKEDHARAVYWFKACCILHNFLLHGYYDKNWTEIGQPEEEDEEIQYQIHNLIEDLEDGKAKGDYISEQLLLGFLSPPKHIKKNRTRNFLGAYRFCA